MQTDQSTDSATGTDRRTFLTRTVVGGALAAGALALPIEGLLTSAGAQDSERGTMKDAEFVAFATPFELAAIEAYNEALTSGKLDREWTVLGLQFQNNHRSVADALIALGDDKAVDLTADVDFLTTSVAAVNAAADQDAVLLALAQVEEALAATHLSGVGELIEASTAKTVTQVLSVEGQQAALLAVGGGTSVDEVTPATNTKDAALTPSATTTTTSTTAATTSTTAGN